MRTNAVYVLGVTLITALLLNACGGQSANVPTAELPALTAVIGDLATALPAMPPGGDFNPHKMSSEVTAGHTGDQAFDHSAATVTLAGAQAEFHPGAGELGWAIYEFAGSPADEIASVGFVTSLREPGALVYVAISSYAEGGWEHLGARNQDAAEIEPAGGEGDYASENGHTYVAIFAFDGDMYNIDFVRLTYANRYAVSGQVIDRSGAGIPNCLITTSIGPGGGGVMTAADGTFTLPAVPDGSWHLMATRPAWVFFNNPEVITVSGGALTGVQIIGEKNLSHFDPIEDFEPNDAWWQASEMDIATPVQEFISASDDPDDYFRFEAIVPGLYYFRFLGDPTIMFPYIELLNEDGLVQETSTWIYSGVVYLGFAVATERVLVMHVSCSGGGGEYQLQLGNGDLNELSGTLTGNQGYVKMKLEAGSDLTYMFTSSGNYGSEYMQPVSTTVTPDPDNEDMYTYAPVSAVVDLSLGDDTGVDFTGSSLVPFENYEPNDDFATAHDFGALPLTSHNPVRIGGSGGDWGDYYRFQPAAGKDIIVKINYDYTRNGTSTPLSAYLYDSTITGGVMAYETDTGLEVRSPGACDGNDYYLVIYCWDQRYYPYTLTIEEFDGYSIEVGGLIGSFGVPGAKVDFYDFDHGWQQTFETAFSGRTEFPGRFMNGETVYVEFFRYGLSCDRYTQTITVAGDDELVWFRADEDESADKWEPNNSYGKLVDYPLDTDATISSYSDASDQYIFTPLSTDPLRVTFDSAADELQFEARLYEHSPEVHLGTHYWRGDAEFMLPTSGSIMHRLEIVCYGGELSYHITIDESPGYMLSGTVLDNVMAPVFNAYVYCPAIGEVWQSGSWSPESNYELGPFQPGTYQIYIYGANWASSPGSPWTLEVTSSDVVQDFELSPNYTDVGEPNDNSAQAVPLTSGVLVAANINSDGDTADWYEFTVGGPGLVGANLVYEKWRGDPTLTLYDTDGATTLASSWSYAYGKRQIDCFLPVAGTYFLRVACFGGANYYTLVADY